MTNRRGALVALPTVLALALGGTLLGAASASAETAPASAVAPEASPSASAPIESGAPAPEPSTVEPAVDEPAVVEPAPTETDTESDAATPAAGDDASVAPVAPQAQPEAGAETEIAAEPAYTITSPIQGQVLTSLGVVIRGTAPAGSGIDVRYGDEPTGGELLDSTDFAVPFYFGDDVPSATTLTITITGPDRTVLGVESRDVIVDVPTLEAPVITSPSFGQTLGLIPLSGYEHPGWTAFRFSGMGDPGSFLSYRYEPIGHAPNYGSDYNPPQVAADGTWVVGDALPVGRWRLLVSQYGLDAEGFLSTRTSAPAVTEFELVRPVSASTPVTPPTTQPVATVLVPTATRPVAAAATGPLAYTGSDGSGEAALAGLLLLGVGVGAVVVARRRATRG
ncbi:hypothetical protein ACPEEZ_05090 [Frigoribacterium sp. 2-23]|uniref:hypothetical protein n=1 Tax=Frigoribacterium sp. 2-23 TaxID=3415006 RepID=UPI003C6EB6E0